MLSLKCRFSRRRGWRRDVELTDLWSSNGGGDAWALASAGTVAGPIPPALQRLSPKTRTAGSQSSHSLSLCPGLTHDSSSQSEHRPLAAQVN